LDTNEHASARSVQQGRRSLMTNIAVCDQLPLQEGIARKKGRNKKMLMVSICRTIVEDRFFTILTTLLTVYALTGDDCRLMFTDKPADVYFNIVTLVCIFVFSMEVILSCVGKEDYLLGFFFWLDILSTATLVLDLTWVAESYQSNEEGSGGFQDSSSLVLGARVGRVVRILRLVRIFKLYKAIYEARQAKKRRKRQKERANRLGEAEDDLDWDDVDIPDASLNQSRVSKKLSELTTRRVILLVLAMMLALPWLRLDQISQSATSGEYGADIVHQAFEEYMANPTDTQLQQQYTDALLTYVYYHNWYAQVDGCYGDSECADFYLSHVFWVGFVSQNFTVLEELADAARVPEANVQSFNDRVAAETGPRIFGFSQIPEEALQAIWQPWTQLCDVERTSREGLHRQGFSLISSSVGGKVKHEAPCPEDLRGSEAVVYTPRLIFGFEKEMWHWAFYFDVRPYNRQDAMFGILVTLFVCVVLCLASIVFTNDADKLVLGPVENMISKVYTIQKNPMNAMKIADREFKKEELERIEKTKAKAKKWTVIRDFLLCYSCRETPQVSETVILEKTIIKLGSLLALGFGEAGAEIIAASMRGVDSSNVDVMREGAKVWGIVGCARIKDFSVATEVLKERIMTFVNQIAEVVHGIVNETHGAANKNNGDMFLLIWRIRYDHDEIVDHEQVARYADLSMYAFARILGGIHRSPVLRVYRDHPRLQQKLGHRCRVNLCFGLHYGWAIEGAVGSEFKIDASYLSPNVSIAETIEKATDIYGVNILVAESVHRICTDEMGKNCRLIDKVKTTGSAEPMKLFAMDLDGYDMLVDHKPPKRDWNNKMRFRVRQEVEETKTRLMDNDVNVADAFRTHPDIIAMRRKYNNEFLYTFKMGYQNYAEGEWQVAQRFLEKAMSCLGSEDGPSKALLEYMDKYGFEAPSTWKGSRELGKVGS